MIESDQENKFKNGTYTLEELMEVMDEQKKVFRTTPDQLFGYLLFLFRTEIGVSQEVMSGLLGHISKSTYNKLENGVHAPHFNHVFLLSLITNIPRTFFYELYEYLTELTIRNNGLIRIDEDNFLESRLNAEEFNNLKKNMDGALKANSTPLKEYHSFFGFEVIDKVRGAIKKAIDVGGKFKSDNS